MRIPITINAIKRREAMKKVNGTITTIIMMCLVNAAVFAALLVICVKVGAVPATNTATVHNLHADTLVV